MYFFHINEGSYSSILFSIRLCNKDERGMQVCCTHIHNISYKNFSKYVWRMKKEESDQYHTNWLKIWGKKTGLKNKTDVRVNPAFCLFRFRLLAQAEKTPQKDSGLVRANHAPAYTDTEARAHIQSLWMRDTLRRRGKQRKEGTDERKERRRERKREGAHPGMQKAEYSEIRVNVSPPHTHTPPSALLFGSLLSSSLHPFLLPSSFSSAPSPFSLRDE